MTSVLVHLHFIIVFVERSTDSGFIGDLIKNAEEIDNYLGTANFWMHFLKKFDSPLLITDLP